MKVNATVLRWSRQLHIYLSVLLLVLLVFFGITGVTLNHNDWVSAPVIKESTIHIQPWSEALSVDNASANGSISVNGNPQKLNEQKVLALLQAQLDFPVDKTQVEFEDDLILLDWQLAGESYQVEFTSELSTALVFHTDYGLLAKLNDIHKGRHTSVVWSAVIDISGFLVVLFSFTGLILLLPNKKKLRPTIIVGVVSSCVLLMTATMV
jgi:hypothetical protein